MDDTGGKLVADSQIELVALDLCIEFLDLPEVIQYEVTNHIVLMGISRPLAELYGLVINLRKNLLVELDTLGNNFRVKVVANTLRNFVLSQSLQLLDKDSLQFLDL